MFEHVLVPLDTSCLCEVVLPHAAALSEAFGSRITLFHVVEDHEVDERGGPVDPLRWHTIRTGADAYLARQAERLQEAGVKAVTKVSEGRPARSIIDFVRAQGVDLILLSSHGAGGLSRWNVSSLVQKIIQMAPVSHLIVRAYQPVPGPWAELRYRRLLVPLDSSPRAELSLAPATALASASGSHSLLAHVVLRPRLPHRMPLPARDAELIDRFVERNRQIAADYLEDVRSRVGGDPEIRLIVSDNVSATLHELVEEEHIDLVVMSAHGFAGDSTRPHGSVTTHFVTYGATPLLIVQDIPADELALTCAEATVHQGGRPLTYAQ